MWRMTEHDGIELRRIKRKAAIAGDRFLAFALKQPAFEE
jgi:hypothetical protein